MFGEAVYIWMKDGWWRLASTGDVIKMLGFPEPRLDWVGLDRILQWSLRLPGPVGLFIAAWLGGTVTVQMGDSIQN
jgi:hypothetical protein